VGAVLHDVDLESKQDSFIRHLSRGMVQRMGLATLLVREPELILLDEPASGLDPIARIQLRDILRRLSREGKAILISSHILSDLAGFCTHIAVMNCGKLVVYGSVEDIERQVAGQPTFILRVLRDAEKAETVIRGISQVELLKASSGTFTLASAGGQEAMAELNRRLVSEGFAVVELREHKSSLEDLFVMMSIEQNMRVS
jgi:ABC-2 type transport system ATP-binding protein